MENSTKALLIAASVLIVIILIGTIISIISPTREIAQQSENKSDVMDATMFNSQFEAFFSTDASPAEARALISKLIVSNTQNPDHIVHLCLTNKNGGGRKNTHENSSTPIVDKLQAINGLISNTQRYTIQVTTVCNATPGGYSHGYLSCITIQENK